MKILSNYKASLLIFATSLALGVSAAQASAPMPTTPVPAVFRTHLGTFEITALSDGTLDLPMATLLKNMKPGQYTESLKAAFMTDPIQTSVTAFLINTGTKLVLIDTGAGNLFGPTVGRMLGNLKVAGYQPEQVDAVMITHMHPDHIGGLISANKAAFPNATVYADKADIDMWLSEENLAKAPEANKSFFQGAIASFAPYKKAGKLQAITADGEIFPGIKSKASHGHTAGHTTYIAESQGAKMVFVGDLVHVGAVQFKDPSVVIEFDTDSKEATVQRKAAFTDAAKDGYLLAAPHLPFPGIGHVKTDKKAFAFIPLNFTR